MHLLFHMCANVNAMWVTYSVTVHTAYTAFTAYTYSPSRPAEPGIECQSGRCIALSLAPTERAATR